MLEMTITTRLETWPSLHECKAMLDDYHSAVRASQLLEEDSVIQNVTVLESTEQSVSNENETDEILSGR